MEQEIVKCAHSIAILMATYNGAMYLREQLDSLLSQTNRDWELFVHDDLSNDNTIAILEDFQAREPERIHLLKDYIIKGRGARDSFMWLIEHVMSRYYMLSDQDDIWLPFKVDMVLTRIKEEERKTPNTPITVYTDLELVDKSGVPKGVTFWTKGKVQDDWYDSFSALCVLSGRAAGCTMIFNQNVKDLLFPIDQRIFMHDIWIALKTASSGRCVGIHTPTILYRLHGNNSCGVPDREDRMWWTRQIFSMKSFFCRNKQMYSLVHDAVGCGLCRFLYAKVRVIRDRAKK